MFELCTEEPQIIQNIAKTIWNKLKIKFPEETRGVGDQEALKALWFEIVYLSRKDKRLNHTLIATDKSTVDPAIHRKKIGKE